MRCIFAALAALICLSTPSHAACNKTLKFGMVSYPPYIGFDAQGHAYGLDAEILDRVMRDVGCDYVLREVPFKRGLRDVKLGTLDGMPGVSKTDERAASAYFSLPIRREVVGAFVRKTDARDHNIKSLVELAASQHKVGVVLGGWYGEAFTRSVADSAAFRARIQNSQDFLTLFRWLDAGVVDVAIVDLLSGNHLSREQGLHDGLEALPFKVNVDNLYLMLSKKTFSEDDVATINDAISRFADTDDYSAMFSKHAPENLAPLLQVRR
ncbi:substrate-binding periplasmic protein [Kordiimonas sp.]|uniref:substrate-binding periplasmic protein n=1 Tax=Kordiimonas sp. TaxID=1970157 RepID=UPI003A9113F3